MRKSVQVALVFLTLAGAAVVPGAVSGQLPSSGPERVAIHAVSASLAPHGYEPGMPAPEPSAPQAGPGRRSPWVAGLLQAAFPPLPLGYAYAGDLGRGLMPSVVMVAGMSLFLVEAIEAIDWTSDEGGSDALIQAGALIAGAGYLWGIVGAVNTANDHNASISSTGPSIALVPSGSGAILAVSLPVGRRGGAGAARVGAR